jgi:hypothetical protein
MEARPRHAVTSSCGRTAAETRSKCSRCPWSLLRSRIRVLRRSHRVGANPFIAPLKLLPDFHPPSRDEQPSPSGPQPIRHVTGKSRAAASRPLPNVRGPGPADVIPSHARRESRQPELGGRIVLADGPNRKLRNPTVASRSDRSFELGRPPSRLCTTTSVTMRRCARVPCAQHLDAADGRSSHAATGSHGIVDVVIDLRDDVYDARSALQSCLPYALIRADGHTALPFEGRAMPSRTSHVRFRPVRSCSRRRRYGGSVRND